MELFGQSAGNSDMVFEPRVQAATWFALTVFLAAALLIAIARTVQRDVFAILFKSAVLFRTNEGLSKDGEEMSRLASTLFLINFFGIFTFILYNKFHISFDQLALYFALPGYLIYLLIVSWLFTRLSNSDQLFKEIQFYTFLSFQALGILYLIILFVDYFSPIVPETKKILLLAPVLLVFVIRLIRSTLLGLADRMRWYYIILYFWSLEILPVLAAIKLFFPELFQKLIG